MIEQYTQYMEQISGLSGQIASFFVFSTEEFLSESLSGGADYPALVLDPLSGGLSGTRYDNPIDTVTGHFAVLLSVDIADTPARMRAADRARQIGLSLLSRISRDTARGESSCPIASLSEDSIRWEMWGPVYSHLFGAYFTFDMYFRADPSTEPPFTDGL